MNGRYSFQDELDKISAGGQTVDPTGYIMETVLGFCTCGRPWAALEQVLAILRTRKELTDSWGVEPPLTPDQYQERQARFMASCGGENAYYFMLYWLETAELADHGGGVDGSYLTDKGEALLADLELWNGENTDAEVTE
jgi:hypothetical protein